MFERLFLDFLAVVSVAVLLALGIVLLSQNEIVSAGTVFGSTTLLTAIYGRVALTR